MVTQLPSKTHAHMSAHARSHTHTHARTHTHTHAHTHARTRTHRLAHPRRPVVRLPPSAVRRSPSRQRVQRARLSGRPRGRGRVEGGVVALSSGRGRRCAAPATPPSCLLLLLLGVKVGTSSARCTIGRVQVGGERERGMVEGGGKGGR